MKDLNTIISQKQTSEEDLLELKGVTGVDVGYKYVKGQRTKQIAIRVMVVEKKENVSEEQQVPKEINGIPTDVIERTITPFAAKVPVENISQQADTKRYDPVKGGISIGPERSVNGYVFAGTLGCMVKDKASGQSRLLSNFHVMAVNSDWEKGDLMVQPSRVDGGSAPKDSVGTLAKANLSDDVDGALCTLSGRNYDCSIVDIGDIKGTAGAVLNKPVRKRGRTTLLTHGFVDSINGSIKINYGDDIGNKILKDQIGIRPDTSNNKKFSDHGDSGSVVVDNDNKIIGLLFAGSEDGYTYINRISNVMDELDIQICTKTNSEDKGQKEIKGTINAKIVVDIKTKEI